MRVDHDTWSRYDHRACEAEHFAWLADIERWRAAHAEALNLLHRAEAAIRVQERQLAEHSAAIHDHQLAMRDHDRLLEGPGRDDPATVDTLVDKHLDMQRMHDGAREKHGGFARCNALALEALRGAVKALEQG